MVVSTVKRTLMQNYEGHGAHSQSLNSLIIVMKINV